MIKGELNFTGSQLYIRNPYNIPGSKTARFAEYDAPATKPAPPTKSQNTI